MLKDSQLALPVQTTTLWVTAVWKEAVWLHKPGIWLLKLGPG